MGVPEAGEDGPPAIAPNGHAGGASGESGGDPTLAESCRILDVRPEVLRRLLEEFAGGLPPLIEAGDERRLPRQALPLLVKIVQLRNGGTPEAEILRALDETAAGSRAPALGPAPATPPEEQLLARFAALQEEMQRTEERRAEDRDRLLTAMMRTNRELQQLRFELGRQPRRARRRGWFPRFWRSWSSP